MKIYILITSRIIKLLANATKPFSYLFHFLLPNKRFTLPAYSAPLIQSKQQRTIPASIWQTNYTNQVTLPLYLNYLFNRLISPTFSYHFMITKARAEFIKEHYSADIFNAYSRLQIGAAQADFWRVLVLQKYGGVYLDIDGHGVWPLGYLIKPTQEELYIIRQNNELTNYFIASKPDNPNLGRIIEKIIDNIAKGTDKGVYSVTGPGVFNDVLDYRQVPTTYYHTTCNQGNFTNEYFQYLDKPAGKWTKEQHKVDVVKKEEER